MKYANWNVPERGAEIPRALLAAGCTPLLAAILHLRGLSDPSAARSFLRGGAETLTNPLELTGMVDAVQRLTRAVATGRTDQGEMPEVYQTVWPWAVSACTPSANWPKPSWNRLAGDECCVNWD